VADRFEDERGVIQDLLGPVDAVTEIFTRKGAVRGNHIHRKTTQWTYVVSGCLRMAFEAEGRPFFHEAGPGQLVCEAPGVPHAWQALENTRVLVFSRGPRSGDAYESDTVRLEVPLL
jgi:quercetin dioxygenase-like cupin family protein